MPIGALSAVVVFFLAGLRFIGAIINGPIYTQI